jgi:hypothetical protein
MRPALWQHLLRQVQLARLLQVSICLDSSLPVHGVLHCGQAMQLWMQTHCCSTHQRSHQLHQAMQLWMQTHCCSTHQRSHQLHQHAQHSMQPIAEEALLYMS